MAHSAVHFSLGVMLGWAVALPPLLRAWRAGERLAGRFRNGLLLSAALGVWAIVPGLMRRTGLPAAGCDGWWMNVFLLYPAINALFRGGTIWGVAAVLMAFGLPYATLLVAIAQRPLAPPDRTTGEAPR